jgi:hypothetical protein
MMVGVDRMDDFSNEHSARNWMFFDKFPDLLDFLFVHVSLPVRACAPEHGMVKRFHELIGSEIRQAPKCR